MSGTHMHGGESSGENPLEAQYRMAAHRLSHKWEERLDNFELPCPLCRGELEFQGARRNPLYEFAEGEPGVVHPLYLLSLSFVCNKCGYNAEFDSDLFNPAHLAELQGAEAHVVAGLSIRDYQVLVPLTGTEKSPTLLKLGSALAGAHGGEVIALNVAATEDDSGQLEEMIREYRPNVGDPTAVKALHMVEKDPRLVGEVIVRVADQQTCELLMVGWRGWSRNKEAILGTVLDPVLNEATCDVAVVHDRGLPDVQKIMLYVEDDANFVVATRLALDLAHSYDAFVTITKVLKPGTNTERLRERLLDAIEGVRHDYPEYEKVSVSALVLQDDDPVQTIVRESDSYDLLVAGMPHPDWRGRLRRNTNVIRIARNCCPTAIVVSARHNRISSWLHRIFG
jgi:nucleotide-binding universal stress UspA family protein